MNSLFKKFALIIASAAILFAGATTVSADMDKYEEDSHTRFVEIESGGDV